MIFVTVGAQMPFDRLVAGVDRWAQMYGRDDVFAQIGATDQEPTHIKCAKFLTPEEFRQRVQEADAVVAHAGMGTILTALEYGKPVIAMPRRGSLRETRNDHQIASARELANRGLVTVAWDEHELVQQLESKLGSLASPEPIAPVASEALCDALNAFLKRPRAGRIDGIVCFGGVDWWYHNRGHYDIQMMREFSRHIPVLYVNSIGMRTPSPDEGKVFAARVVRKLKSWSQGLQLVDRHFAVLSPVSIPKFHRAPVAKRLLCDQVNDAAAWMGIKRPLVWVAVPTAVEMIDGVSPSALVYQRTDRFEHYPGVNSERIREYDLTLKQKADLTLFCSTSVFEDERSECHRAAFVDHGVDFSRFAAATERDREEPEDIRAIAHPRVGFVGGIDAHTFDPELFLDVASAMPECSFVLVGGCSLPEGWCQLDNVHLLGRKPFEQVADYMAACDVLIMPWRRNEWIEACNPVKLKEYLAVGRPVVSTPFGELTRYKGVVAVANDASEFVQHIRDGIDSPPETPALRKTVEHDTWTVKVGSVVHELNNSGIEINGMVAPHSAVAAHAGASANQAEESRAEDANPLTGTVSLAPYTHFVDRKYWKRWHFAAAALLAFTGYWVTRDAWADIYHLAMTDVESSHIWLVLPIAAWIMWIRRSEARLARRSEMWAGPLLIAVGWFFNAVGDLHLIQTFWHFGAILIVVGCVLTVIGGNVLYRLWPAFAVLVFLIPVPNLIRHQISLPLQTVTANVTAVILETLGTPVSLSGNVIVVNGVSVGIAEACDGIRMVFALVLVCYLYAFGTDLSNRSRLMILALSPIVAIVANVVRLIPTVWLYGYAAQPTTERFHTISGWAMMVIALLALIGMRGVVRWALVEDHDKPTELTRPIPSRA